MKILPDKYYRSRSAGLWIIFIIYLFAIALGWFAFRWAGPGVHILVRLFLADLIGTVVVWAGSALLDNSSVYDPYWSVAPPVILTLVAVAGVTLTLPAAMVLVAVWLWGIRLTVNWATTFKNLSIQDWRYDKYKAEFPRIWQLVNFGGIHLMPTIVVFFALLPGLEVIGLDYAANLGTWAAFLLCIGATVLQFFSDRQMHRFLSKGTGGVCDRGLWKISRHPNYLGEILMWWGIFLILVSLTGADLLWLGFGALLNTLLFLFVSIPLMEKRQLVRRPEYAAYRKRTGMLVPKFFTR